MAALVAEDWLIDQGAERLAGGGQERMEALQKAKARANERSDEGLKGRVKDLEQQIVRGNEIFLWA